MSEVDFRRRCGALALSAAGDKLRDRTMRTAGAEPRATCREPAPAEAGGGAGREQVAGAPFRRLSRLLQRTGQGCRPFYVYGTNQVLQSDPRRRDYLPFHQDFHGDSGAGLGARYQTSKPAGRGWWRN